jgi:TolB-like protein
MVFKYKGILFMKRIILSFLPVFVVFFCLAQTNADTKPTIAVVDFESIGAEEHLGKAVSEIMRTALIGTNKFRVVERAQIGRALSEQKLQKSGVIDDKSAVEIGKLLGADLIIIGSVVKIGTSYTINSRMIDVKTGEATLGKSATGNDLNDLTNLSHTLIENLFGSQGKVNLSTIFAEHFNDNRHGWYIVNDQDKRFEIVGGKYIVESKKGGSWISTRKIPLSQSADFKIDITVQKISGTDDYGFGLIWGAKDLSKYYNFVITGSGYFIHERHEDDKMERIFVQPEDTIHKGSGSSNDLSLKKSGKNLEFYINNKLVGKTFFSPFFGDYLGCVVYSGKNAITVGFSGIDVYGK